MYYNSWPYERQKCVMKYKHRILFSKFLYKLNKHEDYSSKKLFLYLLV